MSLVYLIIIGVLFNLIVKLISMKTIKYSKGLDSMPAIPIIAGFLYGTSAGLWAGVILAVSYHIIRPRTLGYAPLTVVTNIMVGVLAAFFVSWDLLVLGVVLVILYHAVSIGIVSVLGGLGPGYFSFTAFNFFTSLVILYLATLYL